MSEFYFLLHDTRFFHTYISINFFIIFFFWFWTKIFFNKKKRNKKRINLKIIFYARILHYRNWNHIKPCFFPARLIDRATEWNPWERNNSIRRKMERSLSCGMPAFYSPSFTQGLVLPLGSYSHADQRSNAAMGVPEV